MRQHPEKIATEEYIRKGLTFGHEIDPYRRIRMEELPPATTWSQNIGEAAGMIMTMKAAAPLIYKQLGKIGIVKKAERAALTKPWLIGMPTAVAKAGAVGALFGAIKKNEQSFIRNVVETSGVFAGFTAILYPLQMFFAPVIKEAGKGVIFPKAQRDILGSPVLRE